ncbi:Cyclin-dependent kinase inhibitor 1C Cyclin-dependent kinase inhibitor p57 p57Kip2 [Channa argus]|uniref:Cyclin-dependent kinase inhibitor 1C Cyclin-dependent kinase inhibitor p57 p57Kip2 n=1 Tax=Channa argus TaxID=215402 RepID=A0A6G1P9J8_CHAAH|nr:Cyclin-dependent kinase inhibitor 1C Cyclin-dependent kinase inhibitor p57 p57Kip2 [Channa argus]KAK2919913.1 hypothetical protein Q8A73_002117 [Channa argus]
MDPIRRRESVRRSLFGPVDHDQLRRDLKLKLKEITEQDSSRWNFNFQTDMPLPGRFQWEEVPASSAAASYRESTQLKDAVRPSNTEDDDRLSGREGGSGTDDENCSHISNKGPAEVTPVRRKRTVAKATAKAGNNTRITDFFAKRRRTTTTTESKSILNPFQTSSCEAALCKSLR